MRLATCDLRLATCYVLTPQLLTTHRLVEQLSLMGFPPEQCRLALEIVGNDMQRAAEWLLEGGASEEASTSEAGPSNAASASVSEAAAAAAAEVGSAMGGERWRREALRVGRRVEASDEAGTWYDAAVVDTDEFGARIHFMGSLL